MNGEARLKRRQLRRRGMYLLPSLFTSINIAAGYYAITQSLQGSALEPHHFDRAALAIGFAIPFDAIDGRIARMTNTASDFGRELDSLADVITFGVAPSILAYAWGFRSLPTIGMDPIVRQKLIEFGAFISFVFLICGASRLARFNIAHNPEPKNPGRPGRKYFVGMPIPAAAGVVAAVVHFTSGNPLFNIWLSLAWLGLVAMTGFLMVSTWRFWSGKELNLANHHPFQLMVLVGAALALVVQFSNIALLVVALGYMFSGIVARSAYGWQRRRFDRAARALPPTPESSHSS